MYPTPPSLVKFARQLSGLVMGFASLTPSKLHVPEERNGASPCSMGMPSTALAVSWVAHSTTLVCPPTSAAMSGSSEPRTVPGAVSLGNIVSGRPSACKISGSYSPV